PLIQTIIGTWKHLFGGSNGSGDFKDSADYPRIINKRQFDRLEKLLQKAKTQNTLVFGGKSDAKELYMEPTIFTGVSVKDEIMKDEIFGPLLPIIDCETIDDAISIMNQQEHALNANIFTKNQENIDRLLLETRSGALNVNDIAAHMANHGLPFGGVGHSGIGGYHGKYSIEAFSHKRAVMIRNVARL
ncbi:Aldehyde dehydrogenase, partial [Mortierella sp. NVP85]